MSVQPKVSICIPAYEGPELLNVLLNSISVQTFRNFEVIITDDSTSNSVRDVVVAFDKYLPDIRYLKNVNRKGSPENWNEAIRHASGKYIKIMHNDDWFAQEDALSEFVAMLENKPLAGFGFCRTRTVGPNREVISINSFTDKQLKMISNRPECLYNRVSIGSPSVTIFKKELDIFFDHRIKYAVDFDFYIRALKSAQSFAFHPSALVCVTSNASHQVTRECTNNKNLILFEYLYVLKKLCRNNLSDYKYFIFVLLKLLYPYRVVTENDLHAVGLDGAFPNIVKSAMFVNKLLLGARNLFSTNNQ